MHKDLSKRIIALRVIHLLVVIFFTLCLIYLYFVGFTGQVNELFFTLAIVSLALEGIALYAFNGGDCPLIHIQRKIGDDKPFFELIFPSRFAKQAIPLFALLTIIAISIILFRFVHN